MYEIIYKKKTNKDTFPFPDNPPNNLKKLKSVFDLSDREFAELVGIRTNYFNSVLHNKSTFSGSTTLKIIKKLNISFSMLYDIQDTINMPCKCIDEYILVIKCDKQLAMDELYGVISQIYKDYIHSNNDVYVDYIDEVKIRKSKLTLNLSLKLPKTLVNKYKYEFENIPNIDNNSYYYVLATQVTNIKSKDIEVDTLKSLDLETNHILNSVPFTKVSCLFFPKGDYTMNGEIAELKEDHTIVTSNGLITTNVIPPNRYTVTKDEVLTIDNIITATPSTNKLKLYRILKNYSLDDMAKFFNISTESYRLIEIGHNKLTTMQMWTIENKLGILLENILDIDEYCKEKNIFIKEKDIAVNQNNHL